MSKQVKKAKSDFLTMFVDYLDETEVPEEFALWCGIAAVGCSLGRNVFLDMSAFKIYPNEFVVLVAGSGRCRKSTSINAASKLCWQLDPLPNMIAQSLTPEALIEAIRKFDSSTKKLTSCVGYVFVDEFTNFINRRRIEAGMQDLLIPLWDCCERHDYRTKGRGLERIRKGCLGVLGGTTPQSLRDAIPEALVTAGLASRIVFIYARKPKKVVALPVLKIETEKDMMAELQRIHLLRGEMKLSSEAKGMYLDLYHGTNGHIGIAQEMDNCAEDDPRSGFLSRKHTHLMKLGVIISAVEGNEMIVHTRHLEGAIGALEMCEQGHEGILRLVTSTAKGSSQQLVYNKIARRGTTGITRTELIRLVSHRMDSKELNEVISTLKGGGLIDINSEPSGRGTRYIVLSIPGEEKWGLGITREQKKGKERK